MKRKPLFILLTAALIVILLIVEVVIVRMASSYEPEIQVIYATVDIPEGTVISEDMLKKRDVQLSYVHKNSVGSISDITGKVAVYPIVSGEQILKGKFSDNMERVKIPLIDDNNRLFTLELKPDQANGWQLSENQYVDIIFVPSIEKEMHDENGDVNVLRMDNIRIAAIIDQAGQLTDVSGESRMPRYITFEVNTEQDEILAWAKGNGRLEISARTDRTNNN